MRIMSLCLCVSVLQLSSHCRPLIDLLPYGNPARSSALTAITAPKNRLYRTFMFRLRRDFGTEVRLKGGFIPLLDHLAPPDISFGDYMYYREKKQALIGKR